MHAPFTYFSLHSLTHCSLALAPVPLNSFCKGRYHLVTRNYSRCSQSFFFLAFLKALQPTDNPLLLKHSHLLALDIAPVTQDEHLVAQCKDHGLWPTRQSPHSAG